MRAALAFAVTIACSAQPAADPTTVLARARDKLLDRDDRVPNYVCVETVDRSYLKNPGKNTRSGYHPASCDEIMGAKTRGKDPLKVDATDRLRLDVKISEGHEIGSWAGARKFDSRNLVDFVGGGPFGTGPLGTLIGDIFLNPGAHFAYQGEETLNGAFVLKYEYQVGLESSHYLIRAGNTWVPTAFHGGLWIEPGSFDLRRLTAGSSELPPETLACVADMDVTYERSPIGSRDFLLPRTSQLHFVMRDWTETHSLTTFSSCHAYHAESTLRFDDANEAETARKAGESSSAAIPDGLSIRLALTTPIDSETAAAGDVFTAKVVKAVHKEKSKEIVLPAGALVRGRIVRMERFLREPAHYEIGILTQSIEIGGVEFPFYARLDRSEEFAAARGMAGLRGRGVPVWLPPTGREPNVATFYIETSKDRLIVPRGRESDWVTIGPPLNLDFSH